MSAPDLGDDPTTFWEGRYRSRGPDAPLRVNPPLAAIAADLPPGTALDLGCGAGGDTLWLAARGWRVTAVDIAATAVGLVADSARAAGLADHVTVERHDLALTFPRGRFDLVVAQYLQSPFAFPRATVLRTAAQALRDGGRLVVVDHGSTAPWSWNQDRDVHHPSPHEVAAGLDLDPATWRIERAAAPRRVADGPNGERAEVVDHVLVIRRDPATPEED